MTVNDLVEKLANRAKELVDLDMDSLRSTYPEATETRAELVKFCKDSGFTKGKLIQVILFDEFSLEFDKDIS